MPAAPHALGRDEGDLRLEPGGDQGGHVLLHGEQVAVVVFELRGPADHAVGRVDQLDRHADPFGHPLQRAFEQKVEPEFLPQVAA